MTPCQDFSKILPFSHNDNQITQNLSISGKYLYSKLKTKGSSERIVVVAPGIGDSVALAAQV